jgi:uncharacterized protein
MANRLSIQPLLVGLVSASTRYKAAVFILGLVLMAVTGLYSFTHLGFDTDVDQLFSARLPWKQREAELNRDFPQFKDLIVAVIDGRTPEEAEETAAQLNQALAGDHTHFRTVRRPDASPFFDQEGLLFLDTKALTKLLDSTIDAQPFIGQLVSDPSARGLFSALSLVGMGVQQGQADLGSFEPALRQFHATLASAIAGHPEPLSWQHLLGGSLADQAGPYRFVLAQPVLDYEALEPGGAATQALRDAAAKLPDVQSGRAHVRVTGSVPLADEEFATVAQGALVGTLGSAVLIALWLLLALRSWRLIVPVLLTLCLGLLLTIGFATLTIGTLNLISVAFAILFVGIAVDFAIQFSVRFREARLETPDIPMALALTARRAGVQVLVAAAATAAGFLSFVPTAFSGVAELGAIAGAGMLIAFACTVTFLPAGLAVCRPRGETAEVGLRFLRPLDAPVAGARLPILGVSALIAIAGIVLLPSIVFDADPLHTKDPNTEAMRTLSDLISNPLTTPYSSDILLPALDQVPALADRLDKLPLVQQVLSLDSFVPADQQAKLAAIADASGVLGPTLLAHGSQTPVKPDDIRLAAHTAANNIAQVASKLPKDSPLLLLGADLNALETAPDATVLAANAALTRFLPTQLDRLRTSLTAQPVTAQTVPPDIARDWILPDGRARVQAVPKPAASGNRGLREFVAQVSSVTPEAGGSAVTIVATSRTIISAFRQAAISALIVIAIILFVALRRVLDVGLVLAPLLLSSLATVVLAVVLPLPLNYANIIALPLLLGVGVSFNIYFVMNWRAGQTHPLGSATARAVLFSALTTGTAFGSLALSRHPGTASMGELLLLSLGCTLAATLVFIPALLAALRRPFS